MRIFWELFIAFTRIGTFTFGGGYAMLPMIQKEVVEKYQWASPEEIMDYFSIGQITPGVIAVNTATFIGYKVKGIMGGIVATLGVIISPIIILTLISAFLRNFADLPIIIHAFNGIRACVCVLIFDAVYKLARRSIVDKTSLILFCFVTVFSVLSLISPVLIVILSGICGVIIKNLKHEKEIQDDC